MKRRIFITLALVAIILCSATVCFAATTAQTECADALYELGLFDGTGKNADGTPIYSLDKTPTRAEAITMLVRLLGKEEEAKSQTWETPFTDLPTWVQPYVGYAYNSGLTTGISATEFGSTNTASETQYLTFVLRALGYDDSQGDFKWNEARLTTDSLGITSADNKTTTFTRGNIVEISYSALSATMKDSDINLLNNLYQNGAVSVNEIPKLFSQKLAEVDTSVVPVGNDDINAFLLALEPDSFATELNEAHLTHFIYYDLSLYSKICNYLDSASKTVKRLYKDSEMTPTWEVTLVRVELTKNSGGKVHYSVEKFLDDEDKLIHSYYQLK